MEHPTNSTSEAFSGTSEPLLVERYPTPDLTQQVVVEGLYMALDAKLITQTDVEYYLDN